jgi:hypothetical protein
MIPVSTLLELLSLLPVRWLRPKSPLELHPELKDRRRLLVNKGRIAANEAAIRPSPTSTVELRKRSISLTQKERGGRSGRARFEWEKSGTSGGGPTR